MSHEYQGSATFQYTSPAATLHTIVHSLGTLTPDVTVIDDSTNQVIDPSAVTVVDANTVQITFFVARAIRGEID